MAVSPSHYKQCTAENGFHPNSSIIDFLPPFSLSVISIINSTHMELVFTVALKCKLQCRKRKHNGGRQKTTPKEKTQRRNKKTTPKECISIGVDSTFQFNSIQEHKHISMYAKVRI